MIENGKNGLLKVVFTGIVCLLVGYVVNGLIWSGAQTQKLITIQEQIAEQIISATTRNEHVTLLEKNQAVMVYRLDNIIDELKDIKIEIKKRNK